MQYYFITKNTQKYDDLRKVMSVFGNYAYGYENLRSYPPPSIFKRCANRIHRTQLQEYIQCTLFSQKWQIFALSAKKIPTRGILVKQSNLVSAWMGAQFFQGFCLDLTHALSRHTKFLAHFFEGMHLATVKPESHHDNFFLTR